MVEAHAVVVVDQRQRLLLATSRRHGREKGADGVFVKRLALVRAVMRTVTDARVGTVSRQDPHKRAIARCHCFESRATRARCSEVCGWHNATGLAAVEQQVVVHAQRNGHPIPVISCGAHHLIAPALATHARLVWFHLPAPGNREHCLGGGNQHQCRTRERQHNEPHGVSKNQKEHPRKKKEIVSEKS